MSFELPKVNADVVVNNEKGQTEFRIVIPHSLLVYPDIKSHYRSAIDSNNFVSTALSFLAALVITIERQSRGVIEKKVIVHDPGGVE